MIHSESSELCFATSSRVICAIFEVVDRAGYCLRIWYNVPSKLCNNYSSKILGICRRSRGSNREEYKKKKGREQKYKAEETLGGELNSLPRILLYGASASFYDSPIDGRALEVMTHSQSSCVRVRLLDQETLYNHMGKMKRDEKLRRSGNRDCSTFYSWVAENLSDTQLKSAREMNPDRTTVWRQSILYTSRPPTAIHASLD